jgi:prolyl oligopeptidase
MRVGAVILTVLALQATAIAQTSVPQEMKSPLPAGSASVSTPSPVASATAAPSGMPTKPPVPAPSPVTDTYFGTQVTDPYRYFEDLKNPQTQAFFKDQNDYANAVLARIPNRQKLFQLIKYLDNLGIAVGSVNRVNNLYFYDMTKPGWPTSRVFVRSAAAGTPRLLINPDRFVTKPGEHQTIDFWVPSYDGKYVAFGVSPNGSEEDVTRVVRVSDGKMLSEAITRTRFGITGWDVDNKAFFYNRLPKLPPNAPPVETQLRPIVYRHVLGTNSSKDKPIFGINVNRGIPMAPTDIGEVTETPGSRYVVAFISHGVLNELTAYIETIDQLKSGRPAWRKIFDVTDDVTGAAAQGDILYLLTHKNAPNFKIVALDMAHPTLLSRDKLVVPTTSHGVVETLSTSRDGLYVQARDGGIGQVFRVRVRADGTPVGRDYVKLPYEGNVVALTTDPRIDGATFGLTAWTKTLLFYATRPNLTTFNTKLKPPYPISASEYESVEAKARSADGTMVPISIIFHKGIKLDGSHNAYLMGYGSYGVTITPYFDATRLAWLEHDGVYAVCHPRGGGWYGDAWHRAGMISTKQHTVQDFIACGRYLVEKGYTSSSKLAGEGTSAGGITIGDAIVQAPKLFAAALDIDGVTDALRSEFEPNGPANIPEFGSVKTKSGFEALYKMDAYLHVKDGTPYPAVFINTGMNDPRVSPAEAAKFAARLQAATSSGRPVLLHVNYAEGHGMLGASREQSERLLADEFAFLLWQLGDPRFQPSK